MELDQDLQSIQAARHLIAAATRAQQAMAAYSQEQVDKIVAAMVQAGEAAAHQLAELAVSETGYGNVESKVQKNLFGTRGVWGHIKDLKTCGILREDRERRVVEIAWPVGVVAGITPSTNPTSTVMFKALIALKGRNAIVFSPHPQARACSLAAAQILHKAAVAAGAPEGIIGCLELPTLEASQELMRHPDVDVILATGGSAMVKAAYSSGKPAYGVGPGNVPAFIERTAHVGKAVQDIVRSKVFDYGTICASEQAVILDRPIRDEAVRAFQAAGVHFLSKEDARKLERVVVLPGPRLNPGVVGRSAQVIAAMADLQIPRETLILAVELDGVGREFPLSIEKLSPVLAFYTADGWEAGCKRCLELLEFGGLGHTMSIHSQDEAVIREFGLKKPVFRIVVNAGSTQGAIGMSTGLVPSLSLGCGSPGKNVTSDNIGPLHLINVKRLAYGLDSAPPAAAAPVGTPAPVSVGTAGSGTPGRTVDEATVARIVTAVLQRLETAR